MPQPDMPRSTAHAFHAPARPPSWSDRFGREHSLVGWLAMYVGTIIVVVGSYPASRALGAALYRLTH